MQFWKLLRGFAPRYLKSWRSSKLQFLISEFKLSYMPKLVTKMEIYLNRVGAYTNLNPSYALEACLWVMKSKTPQIYLKPFVECFTWAI